MANLNKSLLNKILQEYGKVSVALSGGTDSSVLIAYASKILGSDNCIGLTAIAPYMRISETNNAIALTKKLNVKLIEVPFNIPSELDNNPPQRCYLCKHKIFKTLQETSNNNGFKILCDGTNLDDLSDFRPGMKALQELNIVSPFLEAKLGKAEIFELAKELDIQASPASACLMTRFEHNTEINTNKLRSVEYIENVLNTKGFKQCRLRIYKNFSALELEDYIAIKKFNDFNYFKLVSDLILSHKLPPLSEEIRIYKRGSTNIKETTL